MYIELFSEKTKYFQLHLIEILYALSVHILSPTCVFHFVET